MSLQKILEQIKTNLPFAEEDVDSGPVETLNGRRGRKRTAQETVKRLTEEYTAEIMRSAVFFLVTGTERDEFTKHAVEGFRCFTSDAEEFYRDLANRIPEALYSGKESVANLFDVVSRHLEDKAGEMNIIGYPMLMFKNDYRRAINGKEDFVQLLKRAINDQVGGEMVGIQAVRSIAPKAIKAGHKEKITPIVLSVDDQLAKDLEGSLNRLSPHVFTIVAGEGQALNEGTTVVSEVNDKSVGKTLKTLRASIKK
jgi:hypothetical protein